MHAIQLPKDIGNTIDFMFGSHSSQKHGDMFVDYTRLKSIALDIASCFCFSS